MLVPSVRRLWIMPRLNFLRHLLLPEEGLTHQQGQDIQSSVESERSLWLECSQHSWERERKDARPKIVRRHRPRHPHFSVGKGEALGRVRKRDGSFSWRVERREKVDEEGNKPQMRVV